jgi:hypothetical protein
MAYTVKQVATMSKISVRTLHFYDQSGLLKPAYYNHNGYRFYEEPQRTDANQICLRVRAGHQTQTSAGAVWAPSLRRRTKRNLSGLACQACSITSGLLGHNPGQHR